LDAADAELPTVEAALATLPALRVERAALDGQAAADTERQRLGGVREHLHARLALLPADTVVEQSTIDAQRQRVAEWEADAQQSGAQVAERTQAWTAARATAAAQLSAKRAEVSALLKKQTALLERGAEAPCETCGQAMGAQFA